MVLALVVQKMDKAIHWINLYPLDSQLVSQILIVICPGSSPTPPRGQRILGMRLLFPQKSSSNSKCNKFRLNKYNNESNRLLIFFSYSSVFPLIFCFLLLSISFPFRIIIPIIYDIFSSLQEIINKGDVLLSPFSKLSGCVFTRATVFLDELIGVWLSVSRQFLKATTSRQTEQLYKQKTKKATKV